MGVEAKPKKYETVSQLKWNEHAPRSSSQAGLHHTASYIISYYEDSFIPIWLCIGISTFDKCY